MSHGARETLKRIGDLVEVAFKMTVQLGEESDLVLRPLFNALDHVHQAIDDVDTFHKPTVPSPPFHLKKEETYNARS